MPGATIVREAPCRGFSNMNGFCAPGCPGGVVIIVLAMLTAISRGVAQGGKAEEAAVQFDPEKMRVMLRAQPELVNGRDAYGQTLLHVAAASHQKALAELLVEHHADVDAKDKRGATPLHLAAQEGDREIAGFLIEHHAATNIRDDRGDTPAQRAIVNGRARVLALLLDAGANPDARDGDGQPSLYLAVAYGSGAGAELLLQHGVWVNGTNGFGFTPLYGAVLAGRLDLARMLVAHGADPMVRDKVGDTALALAERRNRRDFVDAMRLSDRR
jgi:ankyrin repeat protein